MKFKMRNNIKVSRRRKRPDKFGEPPGQGGSGPSATSAGLEDDHRPHCQQSIGDAGSSSTFIQPGPPNHGFTRDHETCMSQHPFTPSPSAAQFSMFEQPARSNSNLETSAINQYTQNPSLMSTDARHLSNTPVSSTPSFTTSCSSGMSGISFPRHVSPRTPCRSDGLQQMIPTDSFNLEQPLCFSDSPTFDQRLPETLHNDFIDHTMPMQAKQYSQAHQLPVTNVDPLTFLPSQLYMGNGQMVNASENPRSAQMNNVCDAPAWNLRSGVRQRTVKLDWPTIPY